MNKSENNKIRLQSPENGDLWVSEHCDVDICVSKFVKNDCKEWFVHFMKAGEKDYSYYDHQTFIAFIIVNNYHFKKNGYRET